MKKVLAILFVSLVMVACKTETKTEVKGNPEYPDAPKKEEMAFTSFGEKISYKNAFSAADMKAKYDGLKVGDTIDVKFSSSINEVCSKKGCWMKLGLEGDEETMVRFKDYGFFMPLDSKGREVIVEGKAFVKEVSVDELKHYAEDAGKSKEEIAKITEPKREYAFEAKGVLMKK